MTMDHGGVSCSNSVEAATLMDYWLALLPSTDEDAIEEHLMTCDACGNRLRQVISLSESLRTLARSGSLMVVVSSVLMSEATVPVDVVLVPMKA